MYDVTVSCIDGVKIRPVASVFVNHLYTLSPKIPSCTPRHECESNSNKRTLKGACRSCINMKEYKCLSDNNKIKKERNYGLCALF